MLDGDRPRPNVPRSVAVCVLPMATLPTMEDEALAVGRRDMAAVTTTAARVLGADQLEFDPLGLRLIPHLEGAVGVRPAMDLRSQVLPFAQGTVPYVPQVFHHDPPRTHTDRVANQCLTCPMEQVRGYGCLVARQSPKETPGTTGANRLDGGADAPDATTVVVQHPTAIEKCPGIPRIGRRKQPLHPRIDSDNGPRRFRLRNLDLIGQDQIPLATDPLELGILPAKTRQRPGIQNRKNLAPQRHPAPATGKIPLPDQRHDGAAVNRQNPPVVGLGRLIRGSHRLAQRTRQLRSQPKLAKPRIKSRLKPVRIQLPRPKNNLGKPVGRLDPVHNHRIRLAAPLHFQLDCPHSFH